MKSQHTNVFVSTLFVCACICLSCSTNRTIHANTMLFREHHEPLTSWTLDSRKQIFGHNTKFLLRANEMTATLTLKISALCSCVHVYVCRATKTLSWTIQVIVYWYLLVVLFIRWFLLVARHKHYIERYKSSFISSC